MKHGRLIDADALIEAYDRAHEGEPGKARQLILDAPTIEERKTGHWREAVRYPYRACSECGATMYLYEPCKANFCPNCGAKMEG